MISYHFILFSQFNFKSEIPYENSHLTPLRITSFIYVVTGWSKFKRRRLLKLAHKPWVDLFLQSISGKVLLRTAGAWHLAKRLIQHYQFLQTIALLVWHFLVHRCLVLSIVLPSFCKTSGVPETSNGTIQKHRLKIFFQDSIFDRQLAGQGLTLPDHD